MISPERSSSQSPRSQAVAGAPFLWISVMDPVKMGTGVQAYISYRVITKTNLPEFEGPEKIVIRRYSDFEWLHDRLAERYKGVFIPPLPEKNAVEKFRFSKEFIELRRQALDLFVNRIASHPELKQSDVLRTFLQADEEIMDRARSYETGIFKKPSDFLQMFKDVQSKVSDVVLGKEKPVEESTPEYEKLKSYIFELEIHLAEAQKQAYRLVKRHRELGQSLADFGKAIKLLGSCEGDLMEKVFSEVGSKSEMLSIKLQREAIRADGQTQLSHEIALELSQRSAAAGLRPIGAVVFMQRGVLKVCLRTTDSTVNTSEIAKAYGGGGKRSSSSFTLRMDEFNIWTSVNS